MAWLPGGFGQQHTATGTGNVKYNPVVGTDEVTKCGTSHNINIKYHCITFMKEYESKSLEELRLEDYQAGRKGSSAGVFGGFSQPAENKPLFGDSSTNGTATSFDYGSGTQHGDGCLDTKATGPFGDFFSSLETPRKWSFGTARSAFAAVSPVFGTSPPAFGAAPFRFGDASPTFGAASPSLDAKKDLTFQAKPAEGGLDGSLSGKSVNNFYRAGTLRNKKVARVYKCTCGLCFHRLEFLFKHFDNCSPWARIVKIHCVCGLVFDKYNFPQHCEVHRQYTHLHVKKVVVNHENYIDVRGMTEEFKKDDETNLYHNGDKQLVLKTAEEALKETDRSFSSMVISPVAEHVTERKETEVSMVNQQTVTAVIEKNDDNEAGDDGEAKKSTTTLTVADETEKANESPNTTNKDDHEFQEVIKSRESKTHEGEETSDDVPKEISVPVKPGNEEQSEIQEISKPHKIE